MILLIGLAMGVYVLPMIGEQFGDTGVGSPEFYQLGYVAYWVVLGLIALVTLAHVFRFPRKASRGFHLFWTLLGMLLPVALFLIPLVLYIMILRHILDSLQ